MSSFARALRLPVLVSLFVAAGCGGKTELASSDESGLPSMGSGGAVTTPTQTTLLGGGTSIGSSLPAGSAAGGALSGCYGPIIDKPNGYSHVGPNLAESQAEIWPSCSSSPGPTKAQFFILQGGAGLIVDTYGSDFDTILAVYDGNCSATELACDDDGAPGLSRASRVTIPRTSGNTVTLVVSGYGDASGTPRLQIGDETSCKDRAILTGTSAVVTGTTRGSEDRYVSNCSTRVSSPDERYIFAPAASGVYDIAITESDFDPLLVLVEDHCLGRELLCLDDRAGNKNPSIGHYLEVGRRYVIVVDSFGGTAGNFVMTITLNAADPGYCCVASTTRASCTRDFIASCVCKSWPTCCSEGWTEACLLAADALGCGTDARCGAAP